MTILVTGGAGFIGANIVKALNERGITDIIAVDKTNLMDTIVKDGFHSAESLQ